MTVAVPDMPPVRYAPCGDSYIAYQQYGDGPDLLWVGGWATNLDLMWDEANFRRTTDFQGARSRITMFDRLGFGISDPVSPSDVASLDSWMDQLLAVMGATGLDRPVVYGHGHGGTFMTLFAATHPDRVKGLILSNSYARLAWAPDHPIGVRPDTQERMIARLRESWGTGQGARIVAPSCADDPDFLSWVGRYERQSASPGLAVAMFRAIFGTDVRHLLPMIRVPTLVIHSARNRFIDVAHARFLVEHIPGARLVELDSDDDWWHVSAAEEGTRVISDFAESVEGAAASSRMLATLLFTDIVGSTERAAELGDARWKEVLDEHDRVVRDALEAHRGRLVNPTGDGILATFDAPGRAVQAALRIRDAVRSLGLDVRVGVHTGEVEVRGNDVGGIAVHIAARVMGAAGPGKVYVSAAVPVLVAGSGLAFADRGVHELKGVPGEWPLFEVAA